MTNKINSIFALGILIIISMACNFSYSTANLSELKFGKDKDANGANTIFNPNDEIFAVTAINNASGTNKIKYRLLYDKVEGGQTGAVAYKIEKEMPIDGSRAVWLNFSVPGGFISGSYKFEAVLSGENGKEFDRKTGTFTIAGGNTSKPADTTKPKAETDSEDN